MRAHRAIHINEEAERPPFLGRVARMACASGLLMAARQLVLHVGAVRRFEAIAAERLLSLFLDDTRYVSGTDVFLLPTHDGGGWALRVTTSCSVTLLLVPLLVVGAGVLLLRRFSLVRAIGALAVACAVLVGVNVVRIALVGVGSYWWKHDGYELFHRIIGPAVLLVGMAGALAAAFGALVGRPGRFGRNTVITDVGG